MGIVGEAAYVKAPIAGRVIRVSVTSSGARFAIPALFAGQQCTFRFDVAGTAEPPTAAPAECDILFGSSTVSVTHSTESSVGSEIITVNTATGWSLRAGEATHWVMPSTGEATHFYVDTDGTSGELVIAMS